MQQWEWTLIFFRCVGRGRGERGREGSVGRRVCRGGSSICMHILYITAMAQSAFIFLSLMHTLIQHAFHFEELKSSVLKHSLLFERLMVKVGDTW